MPPHRDNIPLHTLREAYHLAPTIATSRYVKVVVPERVWRQNSGLGVDACGINRRNPSPTPSRLRLLLPPCRHGIPRLTRQPSYRKGH